MNKNKQLNVRVPKYTIDKIKRLRAHTGLTQTQLIIAAIDTLEAKICKPHADEDADK